MDFEFTTLNNFLLPLDTARLCAAYALPVVQSPAEAGMKSKREGNTRFRLILTLGLAVVLPALTLIYVNFKHVKSIRRDKKVEGLIHRDFQYLLTIASKKINGKAYELTEQARDSFPAPEDSEGEKRRKFALLLSQSPWFAHVCLFDAKEGVTFQPQAGAEPTSDYSKMYNAWLGLEGRF